MGDGSHVGRLGSVGMNAMSLSRLTSERCNHGWPGHQAEEDGEGMTHEMTRDEGGGAMNQTRGRRGAE